jgi:hypothetical protein
MLFQSANGEMSHDDDGGGGGRVDELAGGVKRVIFVLFSACVCVSVAFGVSL